MSPDKCGTERSSWQWLRPPYYVSDSSRFFQAIPCFIICFMMILHMFHDVSQMKCTQCIACCPENVQHRLSFDIWNRKSRQLCDRKHQLHTGTMCKCIRNPMKSYNPSAPSWIEIATLQNLQLQKDLESDFSLLCFHCKLDCYSMLHI